MHRGICTQSCFAFFDTIDDGGMIFATIIATDFFECSIEVLFRDEHRELPRDDDRFFSLIREDIVICDTVVATNRRDDVFVLVGLGGGQGCSGDDGRRTIPQESQTVHDVRFFYLTGPVATLLGDDVDHTFEFPDGVGHCGSDELDEMIGEGDIFGFELGREDGHPGFHIGSADITDHPRRKSGSQSRFYQSKFFG